MELLDYLSALFASSVVLGYALFLVAAIILIVLTHKRESRVKRALRRFTGTREKIRAVAAQKRLKLLEARQDGNIRELAGIVKALLRDKRGDIPLNTYHTALSYVRECRKTLEFDRLYALHSLLEATGEEALPDELDIFLHQEQ